MDTTSKACRELFGRAYFHLIAERQTLCVLKVMISVEIWLIAGALAFGRWKKSLATFNWQLYMSSTRFTKPPFSVLKSRKKAFKETQNNEVELQTCSILANRSRVGLSIISVFGVISCKLLLSSVSFRRYAIYSFRYFIILPFRVLNTPDWINDWRKQVHEHFKIRIFVGMQQKLIMLYNWV